MAVWSFKLLNSQIIELNESPNNHFLKRSNGVPISGVKIPAKIASGIPLEATMVNKYGISLLKLTW